MKLTLTILLAVTLAAAQSESARLRGSVTDDSGAVIAGAELNLVHDATGVRRDRKTNEQGVFAFPQLQPGAYTLRARSQGFAPIEIRNLVLNTADDRELQIRLKVASVSERIEVVENLQGIDTSPAVKSVIGSAFVQRIPLNGRTIQNLIGLTPGTLPMVVGNNSVGEGQISVNGLRTSMNYMTIDGVSANTAVGTSGLAQGAANGTQPGFGRLGTTSNLISIDALEEFKVQTSSYTAEYGRSAGAQIQLTTKSGTNTWHGSLFEYFRNDKLDAANWFISAQRLRKPPLRHNLYGGTFSGPIRKDKTFFFFSHEGTRLRLPQVTNLSVPSRLIRETAAPALKPFFSAIPQPTGPDAANGLSAPFAHSYSNPQWQDSTSVRIDHLLNTRISVFGRVSYAHGKTHSIAPTSSYATEFGGPTTTVTAGANITFSPRITNELRFNWSFDTLRVVYVFYSINGTTLPSESLLLPAPLNKEHSAASWVFPSTTLVSQPGYYGGERTQVNITDGLSWVRGGHLFKFGFDYRESPVHTFSPDLRLIAQFGTLASLQSGVASSFSLASNNPTYTDFGWSSASAFAQDTWKVTRRLTLDYGVRWEVSPPPDIRPEIQPVILDGVSPARLAPKGTKLFPTIWTGFAPRLGAAYLLRNQPGRELVARASYGLFYDSASGTFGNVSTNYFPYAASISRANVRYPFTAADLTPPVPSTTPPYTTGSFMGVYDKDFVLPRIHQWNVALEQALAQEHKLTVTYVGNAGRRLLRWMPVGPIGRLYPIPSPDFGPGVYVGFNSNREPYADSSDYHALQVQFNRRSKHLNVIANYTWAHAIDTGSSGNNINGANLYSGYPASRDRADSTMDRRHIFNTAITWDLPSFAAGTGFRRVANAVTRDWSFDAIFKAESALPFEITYADSNPLNTVTSSFLRPDVVPGRPVWIIDPHAPGGRRINSAAFSVPSETRQGNEPRNFLRGFALYQPDIAIGRRFSLTERMNLLFRAEMFNFLNHPTFGPTFASLGTKQANGSFTPNANFGLITSTLRAAGGVSAIYANGGPRSIQLSLKLSF